MNLIDMQQMKMMEQIMKAEHVHPEDVWWASQIKPIARRLPAVPCTFQDGSVALVTGDPFYWGNGVLDFQQGYDNPHKIYGTCSHTSIANLCTMAGMNVKEPQVLQYALDNKLSDPKGGDTTIGAQLKMLEHYGLHSHCEFNIVAKCERLAQWIEGAHGVICGLNSGVLRNHEWRKTNSQGKITFVYLEQQVGGFAVHLTL